MMVSVKGKIVLRIIMSYYGFERELERVREKVSECDGEMKRILSMPKGSKDIE
jgi:hypothetical protein